MKYLILLIVSVLSLLLCSADNSYLYINYYSSDLSTCNGRPWKLTVYESQICTDGVLVYCDAFDQFVIIYEYSDSQCQGDPITKASYSEGCTNNGTSYTCSYIPPELSHVAGTNNFKTSNCKSKPSYVDLVYNNICHDGKASYCSNTTITTYTYTNDNCTGPILDTQNTAINTKCVSNSGGSTQDFCYNLI